MTLPISPLPADVRDAVARGHTIEAVKLLRAATGLGLKEAKDAIDAHMRGSTARLPSSTPGAALPPSVVEAMRRGDKIDAIRLLREQTGLGLKEAKDAVEAGHQVAGASLRTHSPGTHSPGEVPRARGALAWVVALLVISGVIFYYAL